MTSYVVRLVVLSVTLFTVTSANENVTTFSEWLNTSAEDNIPSLHLVHFGKKSYYVGIALRANYFQAHQFCRYHGMQLLSITSKEENDFLHNQVTEIGYPGQNFWTSGSRLPDNDRWTWMSTGRPIQYSNWDPGEPNNAKNSSENCLEIRKLARGLTWNDLNCSVQLYFICETNWSKDCSDLTKRSNSTVANPKPEERTQPPPT